METEPKNKGNKHLELAGTLIFSAALLFIPTFFYPDIVTTVIKVVIYLMVVVLIGSTIYELNEAIQKNSVTRKVKSGIWFTIKKIFFPLGLFGITARYYYEIYYEGIENFDAPVFGIFVAIALPLICILYVVFFMRKPKSKFPIGK